MDASVKPGENSILVVGLDRAAGKRYSTVCMLDMVPTLRTRAPSLFLQSMNDFDKVCDSKRRVFRWLSPRERFILQGHRACLADMSPNKTAAVHFAGNAYPVEMLASVLLPLLARVAKANVVRASCTDVADVEQLFRLSARCSWLRRCGDEKDSMRHDAKVMRKVANAMFRFPSLASRIETFQANYSLGVVKMSSKLSAATATPHKVAKRRRMRRKSTPTSERKTE
jgi:hypothetical protein